MDLYNSTGGGGWTYRFNWLSGCDPCRSLNGLSWGGVTCENGRVTRLLLNNNRLNGTVPESLSGLTNLKDLDLSVNQLSGSIPNSFSTLTSLQNIWLFGNQLSSIPAGIGTLANLRGLYLQNNKLSGSIPASLGSLTSLQQLWLFSNQLSGEIPTSFGSLTNLQYLLLTNNQLSGSIPASLSALSNIQRLSFGANKLSGCFPSSLSVLCGVGRSISMLSNSDLPGGGDFGAFCSTGAGSDLISASVNQLTVCVGNTVQLKASNGATYRWQNPIGTKLSSFTTAIISSTITTAGTKTFTVTIGNGSSCIRSTSVSVTGINKSLPIATLSSIPSLDSTTPCSIDSITLIASGGPVEELFNYSFSTPDGSIENPNNGNSLTINTSGTYSVLVTNQAGCSATVATKLDFGYHSDYQPLVDLYNSTQGSNWTKRDGWLLGCNPCNSYNGKSWYGITCENDRVTKLELGINNLVGTLPTSLGVLVKLETLHLYSNKLIGNLPNSLGSLTNLKSIEFSSNQLNGNIPGSLGLLSNLESLNLQNNKLTGSIPNSLGELTNLRYLSLDINLLNGSIPTSFSSLQSLFTLSLSGNQLNDSIPPVVSTLKSLRYLNLSNNKLVGKIPSDIGNLQNLEYLIIPSNQLSGSIPASLGQLSKLVWLDLYNNQLSGCFPASLSVLCPRLRVSHTHLNSGLPLSQYDNFYFFCRNGTGSDAYLATASATPVRQNLNDVVNLSASSSPGISYTWTAPAGAVLSNPATNSTVSATMTAPGLQTFTVISNGGTCVPPMTVSVVTDAPCGSPASTTGIGQPLIITGVRIIDCANGSFQILTTGGTAQPINFAGIVGLRNTDPYNCLRTVDGADLVRAINIPTSDVGSFNLQAVQVSGGLTNSFAFDLKGYCTTITNPPSTTTNPPGSTTTTPPSPIPTECGSPTGTLGQSLSITGVTDVRCLTGSFRILTTGGNGQPINFAGVVGLSNVFPYNCVRTADGPDLVQAINNPASDTSPFLLRGVQVGGAITPVFVFDFKGYCARLARTASMELPDSLGVTVIGNPTLSESVAIEIRGAAGEWMRLRLLNEQGILLSETAVQKAAPIEKQLIRLDRMGVMYFLQVATPTKTKTVKIVRQ